jgi:AcrR family transcriptional regulator
MFDATPDPEAPRAARSRAALIEAARALIARGAPLTLARAAAEAGLGRATAYRHFEGPEALTRAACPDPEGAPLPDILAGLTAPRARALAVHDAFAALARRQGPFGRAHLALRLGAAPGGRRGGLRRAVAFRAALAPVRDRLAPADFDELVHALAALTGTEAQAALEGACGLSPDAADRAARRAAEALLDRRLPGGPGRGA